MAKKIMAITSVSPTLYINECLNKEGYKLTNDRRAAKIYVGNEAYIERIQRVLTARIKAAGGFTNVLIEPRDVEDQQGER